MSTISRFSLSMAMRRAERPSGSQQLMLRRSCIVAGSAASILRKEKKITKVRRHTMAKANEEGSKRNFFYVQKREVFCESVARNGRMRRTQEGGSPLFFFFSYFLSHEVPLLPPPPIPVQFPPFPPLSLLQRGPSPRLHPLTGENREGTARK